jgi:hypothetical protein
MNEKQSLFIAIMLVALCQAAAGRHEGIRGPEGHHNAAASGLNLTCLQNTSYANVILNATQVQQNILNNSTALAALIQTLKSLSNSTFNLSSLIITSPNGTQTVDLAKLTTCWQKNNRDKRAPKSHHHHAQDSREWALRAQTLQALGPFFSKYLPQLNPAPTHECVHKVVEHTFRRLIPANQTLGASFDAYLKQQLPTTWSQYITGTWLKSIDFGKLAQEQPKVLDQFIINNGITSSSAASSSSAQHVPAPNHRRRVGH